MFKNKNIQKIYNFMEINWYYSNYVYKNQLVFIKKTTHEMS